MKKQTLFQQVQRGSQQLMDTIFPSRCAGCKRSGTILCSSCIARFSPGVPSLCQRCGKAILEPDIACRTCYSGHERLHGLFGVGGYEEPLRSCIHALKYDGNVRLAEPLGLLLAQKFSRAMMRADAMIAVPLHSKRQQERGYNHAQLLAEICAKQVGVPFHEHMLVKHRATPPQVGLSVKERYLNIKGAFLCAPYYATGALVGRTIVIIDDVATTGATLEECAAPLFAAGAKEVRGLVLARRV